MNDDRGHLVMTIKPGECLNIGDDIEIHFKAIGGNGLGKAVRVAIVAPKSTKIARSKDESLNDT